MHIPSEKVFLLKKDDRWSQAVEYAHILDGPNNTDQNELQHKSQKLDHQNRRLESELIGKRLYVYLAKPSERLALETMLFASKKPR